MARLGRPERNKATRSFRQLRRFLHVINSDKVFGPHNGLARLLIVSFSDKEVEGEYDAFRNWLVSGGYRIVTDLFGRAAAAPDQ